MTFLVTVEIGDMTQVLASRASNVGGIGLGGWEGTRIVLSPLVFQAMLSLLLLPSLLVGGLAILGLQKMWRKECGLVLSMSFLRRLVSRISSQQSWGFGNLEGVVSRMPSGGGLGLGHSSMSEAITSWEILIYF